MPDVNNEISDNELKEKCKNIFEEMNGMNEEAMEKYLLETYKAPEEEKGVNGSDS